MTSWFYTEASRAAFLDELEKLGQEAERDSRKDQVLRALKTIGTAAAGAGLGAGAGFAAEHAFPRFFHAQGPMTPGRLKAVQIGLPILGGVGGMLGDAYRRELNKGIRGDGDNS